LSVAADALRAARGTSAAHARRGRPRDAGADEAILTATIDALADGGIAGLSMDVVARRAGVGKATIYRRWASKEALVLDALRTKPLLPTPDTGTLRGDLLAYASAVVELFNAYPNSDVLPHLIEAACYDDRLADSLRDYNRTRQRPLRLILRRAIERGELDEHVDLDLLVDVALGAFYYRRLFHGERFSAGYGAKVVDLLMRSLPVAEA
jgi:AcrR family transcriptional regulator